MRLLHKQKSANKKADRKVIPWYAIAKPSAIFSSIPYRLNAKTIEACRGPIKPGEDGINFPNARAVVRMADFPMVASKENISNEK